MKNIRIDTTGAPRCWKCGSSSFKQKRTFRSKTIGVVVGVPTLGLAGGATALLTKKKLKCNACGEYSQTGRGRPYKGPKSRRLGKKYGTLVSMHEGTDDFSDEVTESDDPPVSTADEIAKLAEMHASGALTDDEFTAAKANLLSN